jgi:hypothetical protein
MTIEKLIKIQKELKAPKNQFNKFGNYNYRSAEDILEAVKPLLIKEGLLLTISDTIECVNNRVYVKATVTVVDGDFTHSVSAFARESETRKGMDDSQITGATSSYARKYALNGMFCIDDTKDADTMPPKPSDKPEKEWLNPNTDKWAEAVKYLNKGGLLADIEKKYKLSSENKSKLVSESI